MAGHVIADITELAQLLHREKAPQGQGGVERRGAVPFAEYQPIPVEDQVMLIYAATNGYLAKVGPANIKEFEKYFYEYMDSTYPEVGRAIKTERVISPSTDTKLKEGIGKCVDAFLKRIGASDIIAPDEA